MKSIEIYDEFIINYTNKMEYMIDDIIKLLKVKKKEYMKFFEVKKFRIVTINLFDNKDEFRKFIFKLRGESTTLPDYACGTFDKGMVNIAITENAIKGTPLYFNNVCLIPHELFHIMYNELILEKYNIKRPLWLDEGMAQFFSGQCRDFKDNPDNFEYWYKNVIKSTKTMPNLSELKHGEKFVNENYNGYDLSIIAVKFLYEQIGLKGLFQVLKDENKICNYESDLLELAIKNYNKLYRIGDEKRI